MDNKNISALSISGGAMGIVGQFGVTEQIFNRIKPEYFAGISAGSILALAMPTVDWNSTCECRTFNLKRALLGIRSCDIWSANPLNKKGGFSIIAVASILSGKPGLGDMSNLGEYLSKHVPKNKFIMRLKDNPRYKGIFVGSVDFNTGSRQYVNLKDCSYNDALDWVIASSSIPVFAEPVEKDSSFYFDGGVRNHNPGHWLTENYGKDFNRLTSIYSRPENYDISNKDWKPDNVLKVLERSIEIMQMEISKRDQKEEIRLCSDLGIDLSQIFLPKMLQGYYDTDTTRLRALYEAGKKIGKEFNER